MIDTTSGLYSNGAANIDILLKGYDGGHIKVARKDSYLSVRPYLTIMLAAQLVVLQRINEKKVFTGRGLKERFLWVMPESKIGYRTHDMPPVRNETRQNYKSAVKKLLDIQPNIKERQEIPLILQLSPEAFNEWHKFQLAIEKELAPEGTLRHIQGWAGKLSGNVLRIAGLLHVAEYLQSNLVINKTTMEKALQLGSLLIQHALRAFDLMEIDEASQDARELFSFIINHYSCTFTKTEIVAALRHRKLGKAACLTKALNDLIGRGILKQKVDQSTRKPTTIFEIHPELIGGSQI